MNCLPDAKVADVTYCLDSLVGSAGEEFVVMVHIGSNNTGKCGCVVLEAKFRSLGRIHVSNEVLWLAQ